MSFWDTASDVLFGSDGIGGSESGIIGGAWDWLSGGWGNDGGGGGAGDLPWANILGGAIGGYDAAKGSKGADPYFLPGQEQAWGTAFQGANDLYNQGPAQYYPDSTIAPRNNLTTRGENTQLQNLGIMQNLADGSTRAAQQLAGGGAARIGAIDMPDQIGFGLPDEYTNAIMNPIMNDLRENVMTNLNTQAQSQGAFGGSRATQQRSDAINRATGTATDALIRGNLMARQQSIGQRAGDIDAMLTGRNQDITQNQLTNSALLNGINASNAAMNQQLVPGQTMANIGNARSAYDQLRLSDDVARWNHNQNADQNMLGNMFGWLSGNMPSGGTASTPGGDWLDILQGVIQGGNLGGGLAPVPSDGRVTTGVPNDPRTPGIIYQPQP